MKLRLNLVVLVALSTLMVGCASTDATGSKDRGAYGSIGIGRSI